jgi:uncharacterized repeat protein (TIGR01451 family)
MSKFLKFAIGLLMLAGMARSSVAAGPPVMPVTGWPTNLSVVNGTDPNGAWSLFVRDHKPVDTGVISNGWYLTLTTASPVGFAADNALYSSVTNMSLITSTPWNVTLTITNYGPSLSSNVFVSDTLPVGMSLISSNLTSGTITSYGSTLVWSLGNLPVNAGATLTLNFFTGVPGVYTNTAAVSSDTSDPNPEEDMAVATAIVSLPQPPQFSSVAYGPAGFEFAISGNPGSSTIIQASTNLVNWLNVYTNISPFTYTNLNSAGYPALFYRALVIP